ncbi:MAG: hypothetical protein NC307_07810 [Roseburia sp.]|nr:hypothetical protein [Roseburia sp.]
MAVFGMALFLCILAGIFVVLGKNSHGRYTPNESIVIYDMEAEQVLVEDGEKVRKDSVLNGLQGVMIYTV